MPTAIVRAAPRCAPRPPLLRLLALAGGLAWHPAAAQGARAATGAAAGADVGSFTLLVGGQPVGREQFSIRRIPDRDGAVLELRAEAAIGERRTALRLDADSAGSPVRIAMEERVGTERVLQLGGQRVRGRFATLARTRTGEAAREYLLRPGALVLEADAVLLHALLIPREPLAVGDGVTLPSLTPSANAQGTLRVVLEAQGDTAIIGGARRVASRWRVVTSAGEVRLLWADDARRILRMTVPARGLEARRDDVPR